MMGVFGGGRVDIIVVGIADIFVIIGIVVVASIVDMFVVVEMMVMLVILLLLFT